SFLFFHSLLFSSIRRPLLSVTSFTVCGTTAAAFGRVITTGIAVGVFRCTGFGHFILVITGITFHQWDHYTETFLSTLGITDGHKHCSGIVSFGYWSNDLPSETAAGFGSRGFGCRGTGVFGRSRCLYSPRRCFGRRGTHRTIGGFVVIRITSMRFVMMTGPERMMPVHRCMFAWYAVHVNRRR